MEWKETLVNRSRTSKNFVMRDDNVQRNKPQKLFSQYHSKEIWYKLCKIKNKILQQLCYEINTFDYG